MLAGTWHEGHRARRMRLRRADGDEYEGELREVTEELAYLGAPSAAPELAASTRVDAEPRAARLPLVLQPHGRGRMAYQRGDVYDGDWEAGVPHGFEMTGDVRGRVGAATRSGRRKLVPASFDADVQSDFAADARRRNGRA